uniref:Flavoprotein pyridine nucleotide cytochrome reductase-like FAD-binding domain-containing protein n=1 Tax=Gossypium raimondii TaxID=29730 RepID=A0A0D2TL89_GOSRA|nr:hypothetical protein B456_007G253000 [Gossypium raimondii]
MSRMNLNDRKTPTLILPKCLRTGLLCKLDASHLNRGKDSQGEEVIKPYTLTTLDSDVGHFELVIKMYPQGRMSHHFRELRVGDYLAVKGLKVYSFLNMNA